MSIEIWLAFVLAAGVVLIIPGPTILLVMSQAIAHGRRSLLPLVVGVTLGDFTAMTLSLLGLGAVLAASATLFTLLKWLGAIYLIYLGIAMLRARPTAGKTALILPRATRLFLLRRAYVVTALNPKSIVFFVAFMPQFVRTTDNGVMQLILLGTTFLSLAALNAALYGMFAGRLREVLQKQLVQRYFNRCGGTALIGAGIITAAGGSS